MNYQHDMMHCSQEECPKKDSCYRYWLGLNAARYGYPYASFYLPEAVPNLSKCGFYIKIDNTKN